MNKKKVYDGVERVVATYIAGFVSFLVAGNILSVETVDKWSVVKAAGIAALPATGTVVKVVLAGWWGNKKTTSALPESLDPASTTDGTKP